MADIAQAPYGAPFRARWYHRIPVLGAFARDLDRDFEGNVWYLLLTLVSLAGIAVLQFGLPALGLIALAFVPVMFAILIILTLG
ncbi:MAG: hypothetical protein MUE98_09565 [Rhodobacteraceae bacterium]|jgi:hypothetical protein|nr:hypothetical protein [Paracoccaceae bacterium]